MMRSTKKSSRKISVLVIEIILIVRRIISRPLIGLNLFVQNIISRLLIVALTFGLNLFGSNNANDVNVAKFELSEKSVDVSSG
jgi:hypothetical protein